MATAYIEINDSGIIQSVDGEHIDTSPAFAVLDNKRLMLGKTARENARLLPRWTNNRFWHQLNRDPISNATHNIRHHADLAFAHLEAMWDGLRNSANNVIIGVPHDYNQSQLGLLLGMTNEANIPVVGFVNSALAAVAKELAVAKEANQNTVLHLDISLHRITLTEFQLESEIKKFNSISVSETGLFTLWDRWANVVAQEFIHSSRFDPMHEAQSEQQLFDLLPDWIATRDSQTTFDMEINGAIHSTHIPEEKLIQVCQSIYPKIIHSVQSTHCEKLFVSHRFQGFPGFELAIGTLSGLEVQNLSATSALEAVHHFHRDIVSRDGIANTTSLPLSSPLVSTASSTASSSKTHALVPTHLLYKHQARAIGKKLSARGFGDVGVHVSTIDAISNSTGNSTSNSTSDVSFTISKEGAGLVLITLSRDVKLNGKMIDASATLAVGDQISIGGHLHRGMYEYLRRFLRLLTPILAMKPLRFLRL